MAQSTRTSNRSRRKQQCLTNTLTRLVLQYPKHTRHSRQQRFRPTRPRNTRPQTPPLLDPQHLPNLHLPLNPAHLPIHPRRPRLPIPLPPPRPLGPSSPPPRNNLPFRTESLSLKILRTLRRRNFSLLICNPKPRSRNMRSDFCSFWDFTHASIRHGTNPSTRRSHPSDLRLDSSREGCESYDSTALATAHNFGSRAYNRSRARTRESRSVESDGSHAVDGYD